MSRAAVQRASSSSPAESMFAGIVSYFERSELPWHSLLFILPMVVLYEIGTRQFASQPVETRIIAFTMMRELFWLFGATGHYLPALAVVIMLLSWHIARKDPWDIHVGTLTGMAVESAALAVPLLMIGYLFRHYLPLAAVNQWRSDVVFSLGAGIYEEMVFRLICFTVLHLVLIDFLGIRKRTGTLVIVLVSAVAFSFYHYLGAEDFHFRTFAFRTVAGIYFGATFLCRGFGVTAGCHAAYDIIAVTGHLLTR
jgi:membrane protease YdiL (CAAX protease family)